MTFVKKIVKLFETKLKLKNKDIIELFFDTLKCIKLENSNPTHNHR